MPSGRTIAWGLVAASGLLFASSAVPLAGRIADFNRAAAIPRFHAEVQDAREFQLGRYPRVRLTDAADDRGLAALRLDYGSATRLIPVKPPAARGLPTLAAYDEWVKVLAINEVGLDERRRSVPKPGTERLLVVVRRTPEGLDPDSVGASHRDEWLFDFYDLCPDGSVVQSTRRWPRDAPGLGAANEKKLQREAVASADPRLKALAAIPPLEERSAEYFAAMHVIPRLNVPKHKFDDTALSPRVLGWTLPASMLSGLVLVPSLCFALAPRKGRRDG